MALEEYSYTTDGGINVVRRKTLIEYSTALDEIADKLDRKLGVLLSSSYEYPNRYKRWDLGFYDPPVMISSRDHTVTVRALNDRGKVLLVPIAEALGADDAIEALETSGERLIATVRRSTRRFAEEERSRQPSVFSVLRAVIRLFAGEQDGSLGLYGAFGYDLAFQFEEIPLRLRRDADQRDLVLFIPDRLMLRDHERNEAYYLDYDFQIGDGDTRGLPRTGAERDYVPAAQVARDGDHAPGEYAQIVRVARESFARGDLFEVVPGQTFFAPCVDNPSEVFHRLRRRNPSPYGFFMNLGDAEYLVGASPEMFVRVNGRQVESCPISGTIARGPDALSDADQILTLLNSKKDSAELTMCTDVDRNDKSRVCVPGSVQVVARRQIEMYSRLIHTVDHVKGILREEFDALDAFLTHTWAVTVTGAPKLWAMRFLENHEKTPRRWYGGAVGRLTFDGNMNTGLTLRTVRVSNGVAEVRVGATLLYDSDPEAEDAETRLKASAMIDAVMHSQDSKPRTPGKAVASIGTGLKLLLVDHQDSFVHTLANYCRQTGAEVTTWRCGFGADELRALAPDLVVLSPGPGRPQDFRLNETIETVQAQGVPMFGVCLGLQGMIEYCGGRLKVLSEPQHGKSSDVRVTGGRLFEGLPEIFSVGRYHSLHADPDHLPPDLEATAYSEDGVIMAIEHRDRPWAAVQFHPESIMTVKEDIGLRLLGNAIKVLTRRNAPAD